LDMTNKRNKAVPLCHRNKSHVRTEIINTWDQCVAAGGDRIFISYTKPDSRACQPAHYNIIRIKNGRELKTDPGGAWYTYGRKQFLVGHPLRTHKPAALADAMQWVRRKYGARVFVCNRRRDYVEQDVNERYPIHKQKKHV